MRSDMVAQTPWIEREFNFGFPVGHFPVIYSRLQGSIYRLEKLTEHLADHHTGQGGGWSAKKHIGHLTDLEALWWQRLQDFRSGEKMLTAADMSNRKTEMTNHDASGIAELVAAFRREREKMLKEIQNYTAAQLQLEALHPRLQQPMRLIDSLFFVAEHDDHHLAKIAALSNAIP